MYLILTKILLFIYINSSVCQKYEVYPTPRSSLVWFHQVKPFSRTGYKEQINNFFRENRTHENIEPNNWGPCVPSNSYGYLERGTGPCIFIYFPNELIATPHNSTTLPKDAPESLREHIKSQEADPNQANKKFAYVTCNAHRPEDETNIGPVRIYKSFEVDINQNSLAHKLIAVHLENPKGSPMILVDCTFWALFNTEEGTEDRLVILLAIESNYFE